MGTQNLTAEDVTAVVRRFAATVAEQRDLLTELDTAIGDGDHGTNLDRGLQAAVASLEADRPDTPAGVFTLVGRRLAGTVGGASGALYGTAFLRGGRVAGDGALDGAGLAAVLRAGADGIVERGKCVVGDKTMYDVWAAAVQTIETTVRTGGTLDAALLAGSIAAGDAVLQIEPMVARRGRASYLGERSAGHRDPGSVSSQLLFAAFADQVAG